MVAVTVNLEMGGYIWYSGFKAFWQGSTGIKIGVKERYFGICWTPVWKFTGVTVLHMQWIDGDALTNAGN